MYNMALLFNKGDSELNNKTYLHADLFTLENILKQLPNKCDFHMQKYDNLSFSVLWMKVIYHALASRSQP